MKTRTKTANGKGGGKWIRPEKRLAIYLRDRFKCIYCLADLHDADRFDVTLDHLYGPQRADAKGANNHESNLITCCRSCNSSRQDTPLSRWCGVETRKHIKRQTKRDLKPYLALAKALVAGEVGFEETIWNARKAR